VPLPAGGTGDLLCRFAAEKATTILGQQVVVENRAGGAGGRVGMDQVMRAAPDGYTLLCGTQLLFSITHLVFTKSQADARTMEPISVLATYPLIIITKSSLPANNMKEFIDYARANPDKVNYGHQGKGNTGHLLGELIMMKTGIKMTEIPYRGSAPAINDLLAGTIEMMFDVMPALMPHVESGKFKALAVSAADPIPLLPNIPGMKAFADLGLGEHSLVNWNVVSAAGGTPAPIVQRLFEASQAVARQPEFIARLRPLGYGIVLSESPAAVAQMIQAETPRWQRIVEISGARIE
jgi:tripartite-type tricarboxylate transporter receptor subunit TctC